MNIKRYLLIALVVVLLIALLMPQLSTCNQPDNPIIDTPAKAVTVNPPAFNSDSAYQYIQTQVNFGPRPVNTAAHEACAAWMIEKVKALADTVYIQKFEVKAFEGSILKCTNIIASFNPQAKNRILLTTHWDSRPWADQDTKDRDKPILAASDGASGVGILLEVANAIKTKSLNIGVDIFLNDAEDYGYNSSLAGIVEPKGETDDSYCLGSQYWSKHPHMPGYKADFGILLDMVGARNAVFAREGNSTFNAGWVQDKVWQNAELLGYSSMFSNENTPAITDDHHYINQIIKIPTIDIIHHDGGTPTGFATYWHTHNDNMDVIDKATLGAVGRTLLYTIYQYNEEINTPQ